ncbi:hypothetical protein SCALM49S_01373 [Streptomyces californicus]
MLKGHLGCALLCLRSPGDEQQAGVPYAHHRRTPGAPSSGPHPGPAAVRPLEPYLDGLFTYCLAVLCDHDAAADALGAALAVADRQDARCPSTEPERRSWLYALARWACLRPPPSSALRQQPTHRPAHRSAQRCVSARLTASSAQHRTQRCVSTQLTARSTPHSALCQLTAPLGDPSVPPQRSGGASSALLPQRFFAARAGSGGSAGCGAIGSSADSRSSHSSTSRSYPSLPISSISSGR